MTAHSQLVGGSTAGRRLACPGSYQLTQSLPPSADRPSEYAEEGTFAHSVMDHLMRTRMDFFNDAEPRDYSGVAGALLGKTFHDRVLTQDHLDSMILPALEALKELEAHYGGGFRVAAVEFRVRFPNLPGAFGTCDLVLVSDDRAIVVDWKFGQGVPVLAVYDHGDSETLNPQLMYYLAAAINTRRTTFQGRDLIIAIVQPRTSEPLTHTEVSRRDLKLFREDMENAVVAALNRDPPLSKGEHCRWCPAKITCPLWTMPVMGLAEAIGDEVYTPDKLPDLFPNYGDYLAKAKALVDLLAMYSKEVNEQLHAYLEEGGQVPGWRLKAKVKQRQWVDPAIVVPALEALGFETEDIFQAKLQTFQAADRAAKRLGVTIPDNLRVAPETDETTVCPTNDPAPLVDHHRAVEDLAAALKLIAK